jgi:hypothetical protein
MNHDGGRTITAGPSASHHLSFPRGLGCRRWYHRCGPAAGLVRVPSGDPPRQSGDRPRSIRGSGQRPRMTRDPDTTCCGDEAAGRAGFESGAGDRPRSLSAVFRRTAETLRSQRGLSPRGANPQPHSFVTAAKGMTSPLALFAGEVRAIRPQGYGVRIRMHVPSAGFRFGPPRPVGRARRHCCTASFASHCCDGLPRSFL